MFGNQLLLLLCFVAITDERSFKRCPFFSAVTHHRLLILPQDQTRSIFHARFGRMTAAGGVAGAPRGDG